MTLLQKYCCHPIGQNPTLNSDWRRLSERPFCDFLALKASVFVPEAKKEVGIKFVVEIVTKELFFVVCGLWYKFM